MRKPEHHAEIDLLLRHRAWLRALAARLVGAARADDLEQETWVAALRHPPDSARPARPWLAAVARRLALRLRAAPEPAGGASEPAAPPTDELLERVELETRLAREVARLSEPFRRTVLLRYHEGLSAAEIARRERVPAGTVRWRLKRGLDELRARLDREFGDRKSWSVLAAGLAGVEAVSSSAGVSLGAKALGAAAVAVALAAVGARWLAAPTPLKAAANEAREDAELAAAPEPASSAAGELALAESTADERREVAATPAAAVAPAAERGVFLEILEWDGLPRAGQLVLLRSADQFPPEEPLAARTDAAGRAAFPDVEGRARILVERAGKPFQAELIADGREHRFELPRGAAVSGRVLVGGAVPQAPVVVELYRSDELRSRHENKLMRRETLFGDDPILRTMTSSDGSFAFVGLDEDWRGVLRSGPGYVARGRVGFDEPYSGHMIFLREPAGGIELDLDRCPRLCGRVVDQDGVDPVPHALVNLQPVAQDGLGLALTGAGADFEGFFEVYPEHGDLRSVWLEIMTLDGFGRAEYSFERDDLPLDGNLGDLRLGSGRSVVLHVVDASKKPIAGALTSKQNRGSDGGELVVQGLPAEESSIWIAARGYCGRQVVVPAGVEELEVVLAPANAIEVLVRDRDGAPLAGVELEVSTDGPAFLSKPRGVRGPDELTREWSAGSYLGTRYERTADGPTKIYFRADAEGRVELSALQPGAPLRISAVSPCHAVLCRAQVAAPPAGEREAIVLDVAAELSTLKLRAVDAGGAPVERATVALALAGQPPGWRMSQSMKTDAEGRAAFPRLTRDAYRLEVSKHGHLPIVMDDLRLQHEELVVVLARGLDVAVKVKDETGRVVPGGRIDCDVLGRTLSFHETAAGRIDLVGLPDVPLDLTLLLAGARYTQRHDPRTSSVDLVVPEHGSAVVRWAAPAGSDWSDFVEVRLFPLSESQEPLEKTMYKTPSGEWTFPLVLPGKYDAVLTRDGDVEGERCELTQRTPLQVRPGETARADLTPLQRPVQH